MGERYLVIDTSRAYLANTAGLRRAGFASATILDLNKAADGFRRAFRDSDRQFTLGEVAAIAGITARLAEKWYKIGVIKPTSPGSSGPGNSARYSFEDAFAAGCCGALRRQGVLASGLANAFRLLTQPIKLPAIQRKAEEKQALQA